MEAQIESLMSEILTLLRGASRDRARTSVQQDQAQASQESDQDSGRKWRAWFAKWDHATSSWKTPHCSLFGDWESFSGTWPRWGMMQDGACSERMMQVLHISGRDYGLKPNGETFHHTPTTSTDGGSNSRRALKKRRASIAESSFPDSSAESGLIWSATAPSARDTANAVQIWRSPQACNANQGPKSREFYDHCVKTGKSQITLVDQVRNLSDTEGGGSLNPTWVEWLMGWPLFWTTLDVNVKPYYEAWHEAQQRTQASTEEIQNGSVRNVWWSIDPSASPQRRQSYQQQEDQCHGGLPTVPCENPLPDRKLGEGECKAGDLQNLRGDIPAESNAEGKAVWQAGMPEGKRETICRVALGVKHRVDRLKAIGNGQVPAVAALAWRTLTAR